MFNPEFAMNLQARYTIVRKIADGGTAEIFLATQHGAQGFEKPVVLKRIFPAFYADPQFRNMLIDEALIAMSLNHSNIVQVLDLGESQGQYVMALELVDGWTLDSILRRTRALTSGVPPALALYITAEVCRALAYAHAKLGPDGVPLGIVHRDISPHNVLVSEQGEVKLTDFGIAKAQNRREQSLGNMIKGKIAFMSPEQASGTALDARSDLFSLGTMLYVMICRRYPFDAATDLEVLLLVKSGEFLLPEDARPGLNPEVYRVLKRAMSRDPAQRYQRAEDMLLDCEQVMRVAFRAVGQTELKRWLMELSERDSVPPLTRNPVVGQPSTPGDPQKQDPARVAERAATITASPPDTTTTTTTTNANASAGVVEEQQDRPASSGLAATLTATRRSSPSVPAVKARNVLPGQPTGTPAPAPPATGSASPPPPPTAALATGRRAAPPPPPLAARATGQHRVAPAASITEGAASMNPGAASSGPANAAPASSGAQPGADGDSRPAAAPMFRAPANAVPTTRARRRLVFWIGGAAVAVGVAVGVGVLMRGPKTDTSATRSAEAPEGADARGASHSRKASAASTSKSSQDQHEGTQATARLLDAAGIVDGGGVAGGGGTAGTLGATANAAEAKPPSDAGVSANVDASRALASVTARDASVRDGVVADAKTAIAQAKVPLGDARPDASLIAMATAERAPQADAGTSTEDDTDAGASESQTKISVTFRSTPTGAQVTSPRRTFGTTPLSIRLRPGATYALTFSHDGYKPLTKRLEITPESDPEVTVTLKRAPTAKVSAQPAPPPTAPEPKPPARNFWQKMFAR